MNWWEKPLRISAVQCNYGEDSFKTLNEHVKKGYFNAEQLMHLFAEGHMAFYDEKKHGAKLDRYLAEAKKGDIREIIYLNVHCVNEKMKEGNPSWLQLDKDNRQISAYGNHFFTCINGDWFDSYAKQLKDLCSHAIDGIFLDGPVFSDAGCYCEACSRLFEQRYKKPIRSASYNELLEFKVDSVTEFIRKTNQIVKGINPDIMLYLNNSALRADVTGSNTRKVEPYVDVLGAEGGFIWIDRNLTLWYASSMAKYLETEAKGKPTVIFIAGDNKPFSYYMHTPEETKILYAQSAANGANIWYGIHAPTYIMDTPGGRAAKECNRMLAENEEYFAKTGPVSKVALMWSMDSANYYSSSVAITDFTRGQNVGNVKMRGNHYNSFMGFYEGLSRSHIQFDVIDEYNVNDGSVSKYDLLILPTCGCMSRETADGIKKYVKNGGNVISTFDSAFYDEKGNVLETPLLADVMGIRKVDGVVDYSAQGTGFQRITGDEWFREGLSADLLPSPDYAVRFSPAPDAKILSSNLEPMAGRYVALPEKAFPGTVMNRYGKGWSLYFNGTMGEFYFSVNNPDFRKIIANAVNRFSHPMLTTNAPASLDIVLRYQKSNDRYILHLINMTGEMTRPIERLIPLHNVKVALDLGMQIHGVRDVLLCSDVPYVIKNDGKLELSIDEISDYKVYAIY